MLLCRRQLAFGVVGETKRGELEWLVNHKMMCTITNNRLENHLEEIERKNLLSSRWLPNDTEYKEMSMLCY